MSDGSVVVRWMRASARAATGLLVVAALAACQGDSSAEGGSDGSEQAPDERAAAAAEPSTEGSGPGDASAAGAQQVDVSELGVNTGVPGAPIQVVEFSDFGCPHCGVFHQETYPTIYEEYVETGKVFWKYIPFVLGTFPHSLEATRAGHCAIEQGDFTPMRDELFRDQLEWMTTEDPTEVFVGYAREVGLDVEQFRSCFEEGRHEEDIRQALQAGRQVGINGTPTFFIQGQTVEGNRPVEFFRQVFDQMLEQADAQGGATGGP